MHARLNFYGQLTVRPGKVDTPFADRIEVKLANWREVMNTAVQRECFFSNTELFGDRAHIIPIRTAAARQRKGQGD